MPIPYIASAGFSLAAVFVWGTSDFIGGYATRRANAFQFTALAYVGGLFFTLAATQLTHPPFPSRAGMLWGLAAGVISGFALAVFYSALSSGRMGLTAPVAALLGAALPTLVDIRIEGAPGHWPLIGFALAAAGIWLIARPESDGSRPAGLGLAILAGVGFAGFYLCVQQAGSDSALWIAACSRVSSLIVATLIVIFSRKPLTLTRPLAGLSILTGVLDVGGTVLFIRASQSGRLDKALVISSLYPAVTVLLACLFLKERFTRWKFVGLLAALLAVPMITGG
jgi:uncharacterized membrane protein